MNARATTALQTADWRRRVFSIYEEVRRLRGVDPVEAHEFWREARDDLESKGPVKVSEVESEQKEILKIVRRLVEEGQVSIGGKGDDSFV